MENLNSIITKQDIDNYLSGKNKVRIDIIEKALKELILINPIALKQLLKRLLKNSPSNNQALSQAVHKLGDAYWSCFNDDIERKHINSVELDDSYSTRVNETHDIQGGKFRTVQGIANKIGRSRESVGDLIKKVGIKKVDRAFANNDVILIRDLFDNYGNQKARIDAGLRSKNGNNLSFITRADLVILKSKKLKRTNKKTGIFEN